MSRLLEGPVMKLTEEQSLELRKFAIQESVKLFGPMEANMTIAKAWAHVEYLADKIFLYCMGEY